MTNREEFSKLTKVRAFDRAKGHCELCGARLYVGKFHYDHVIPTSIGGPPTFENCMVACVACHGAKTANVDVPAIAKTARVKAKHIGAKTAKSRPMAGSKRSGWKKPMNGPAERR